MVNWQKVEGVNLAYCVFWDAPFSCRRRDRHVLHHNLHHFKVWHANLLVYIDPLCHICFWNHRLQTVALMDALRLIATQQYYNVHNIIYQELSSHSKLFSLLENLYIYFRNKMQILFEENFRNRNKN
jgi:hypothetical protein